MGNKPFRYRQKTFNSFQNGALIIILHAFIISFNRNFKPIRNNLRFFYKNKETNDIEVIINSFHYLITVEVCSVLYFIQK